MEPALHQLDTMAPLVLSRQRVKFTQLPAVLSSRWAALPMVDVGPARLTSSVHGLTSLALQSSKREDYIKLRSAFRDSDVGAALNSTKSETWLPGDPEFLAHFMDFSETDPSIIKDLGSALPAFHVGVNVSKAVFGDPTNQLKFLAEFVPECVGYGTVRFGQLKRDLEKRLHCGGTWCRGRCPRKSPYSRNQRFAHVGC